MISNNMTDVLIFPFSQFSTADLGLIKRCLTHPSGTFYDNILSRLEECRQVALQFRTGAEKLALNNAAILEWVHSIAPFSARFYVHYYNIVS